MLEDQGWRVETCTDVNAAVEKISGEDAFDLRSFVSKLDCDVSIYAIYKSHNGSMR